MKKSSESNENLVKSNSTVDVDQCSIDVEKEATNKTNDDNISEGEITEAILTPVEKKFLLSAERGDCATVRRLILDNKNQEDILNINCVDPLNRSALIAAIENENIELVKLLLEEGIQVKDALLHAIKEEYVEAVELLLQWEETYHVAGTTYSWESVDRDASTFTNDITPLILASHRNNYEIIKLLLDRGATLPLPHDVRCGCDECVASSSQDSLRHSQSRINAYKALSASSLIALSSRDPILTAFELSWELRRLSRMETEFRIEYNEMRKNCQEFATALLDHARTSTELEVMLNFNSNACIENWEPGERQTLERLKLAIKYKQKMFVAHPNVQQLLAAIWYEGLPGFRRKGMIGQMFQVAKLGAMFPIYSMIYMLAPNSTMGLFMKKPFVKFICHSSSYACFLTLLGLASQRVEYLVLEFIGAPWMLEILDDWKRKERGALPGLIEFSVILYIISLIWGEMRALWNDGLVEYLADLWNIVDFISNSFYLMWISLRFTAWYTVQRDSWAGLNPWYPREQWDPFDPMLLSEGAFAAGMIFSFLKLVHIFSINPHLGPLQVSLGRMIIDIIKFFFIYTLVLFAFGCGLNQLMWYYADLEKNKCYHAHNDVPDFDNNEKACAIWRRFANLFETSQSLFWASFGLVDLMAFELQGIKSFTRFWALLMFGSYSVINIIVLLNMLIAMMSNSYQIISERSDVEWKFARSQLWMSYFEDGATLPPPFNLFPSAKVLLKVFGCDKNRSNKSVIKKSRDKALRRHDKVMRLLVRRYITAEQRKRDDFGITEDDVMEIRQDISTLRFELIDILRQNGMRTPQIDPQETSVPGKKGRVMERRILKDFQIGMVEGILNDPALTESQPKDAKDVFTHIAKVISNKTMHNKEKNKDWNALVRKNTVVGDPIGSTKASIIRRSRRSLRRQIIENANEGLQMNTEQLVEFNPKLSHVTPTTRVAYVKFMAKKLLNDSHNTSDDNESKSNRSSIRSLNMKSLTNISCNIVKEPSPDEKQSSSVAVDVAINEVASDQADDNEETLFESVEVRDFRTRTPILEDPNEDRVLSPDLNDLIKSKSECSTPKHTISPSTFSKESNIDDIDNAVTFADEVADTESDQISSTAETVAPKVSKIESPRQPTNLAAPSTSDKKKSSPYKPKTGWL